MTIYIVPNELAEMLYKVVDDAIADQPKLKEAREDIYNRCLAYYNDTGKIPSIKVKPTESPA